MVVVVLVLVLSEAVLVLEKPVHWATSGVSCEEKIAAAVAVPKVICQFDNLA